MKKVTVSMSLYSKFGFGRVKGPSPMHFSYCHFLQTSVLMKLFGNSINGITGNGRIIYFSHNAKAHIDVMLGLL